MKYYVGLDVSSKKTNICIVDENRIVVQRGIVRTEPGKIAEYLLDTKNKIVKIGIESSSLTTWLVKGLKELSLPAICIDSRKMAAFIELQINKNDDNDAESIAMAMQCGAYREVYCKSAESIDRLNLLGARSCLINQRTNISNTIRGLLKSYGIRVKGSGREIFPLAIREAINKLPDFVKCSFESLLTVLETLYAEVAKLDVEIDKIVKTDNLVQKFCTVPGVGPITALQYKAEIDNPKRFKNARACAANIGLTPREYSSGDVIKRGRISKQGSHVLRSLLTECGTSLLTRTKSWSSLKVWGTKLMNKKGLAKAKVAVGRKLAVVLHHMWVDDTGFITKEIDEKTIAKLTKAKDDTKKKRKAKSEKEDRILSLV
jgi:transposase